MRGRRWFIADERGVAMVTVILMGAALTVMATSASFLAIRDLRSGTSSSNSVKALGYAEAGLQRFLRELKLGTFGVGQVLTAGCSTPPVQIPQGTIGDGTYTAQLTVFEAGANPQVPPPWTGGTSTGPCSGSRFTPPNPAPKSPWTYAITATGTAGNATRVIRAIVTISASGLPVGVFANSVNANGNPSFGNISLFARGDVYGREKMTFSGNDLQYTIHDVYQNNNAAPIPAAVHSVGAIFLKANGKNTRLHGPSPNCTASQSLWDGSMGGVAILSQPAAPCPSGPYPPTSKFTASDMDRISGRKSLPQLSEAEYAALKAAAQSTGLYCSIPLSGAASCTVYNKVTQTRTVYTLGGGSTVTTNPIPNSSYVAYFDYAPGADPFSPQRTIGWNTSVSPCSDDPSVNSSAIIVVRHGSVQFRSAGTMYGNAVAPEGAVDVAGSYTVVGSVLANDLRLRGSGTFRLDACGQRNSPASGMQISGGRWSEIDR